MNLPEIAEANWAVAAVLNDPGCSHLAASKTINGMGYQTSETAVRRWRRNNRPRSESNWSSAEEPAPAAGLQVEETEVVKEALRLLNEPSEAVSLWERVKNAQSYADASRAPRGGKLYHLMIPDTQAAPGTPTDHLRWIGHYIVDHFWGKRLKVIHIGDHADMPSLSSYDKKGGTGMEGRRYVKDIQFANEAFELLDAPTNLRNAEAEANGWEVWLPEEKHITLGNHENRINRAVENDAQLEGLISVDDLNYARLGWTVHPYLKKAFIDGIGYVHYLANPMTGHPYGGGIANRLQKAGHSFTMGHQQTFMYDERFVNDSEGRVQSQHGIVAGACYLHMEDYKGPQGNPHWRGVIVKMEVNNGSYDIMKVSLDYLCRRYEGTDIRSFLKQKYDMEYY